VACVLLTAPDGTPQRFVRTVGSRTTDLLALGDWLRFHGVPDGARERTGVRWRPGFTVLEEEEEEEEEEGRTLLLVNAQHRKAVPGRKTAVQDSAWVADPARATACARPVHGLRTACARPASSPHRRAGSCAISPASARRSLRCARSSSRAATRCSSSRAATTRCWAPPPSSWGRSPALGWGRVGGGGGAPAHRGSPIPRFGPRAPQGGCARRCPPRARRWPGACRRRRASSAAPAPRRQLLGASSSAPAPRRAARPPRRFGAGAPARRGDDCRPPRHG
jgi:hypothetical protein